MPSKLGRGTRVHDFLGLSSRRIASFVRGSYSESSSGTPTGRSLAHAPTFGARVAAPERNWRSVAGHLIHQTVAVGLPTFAREMLAAGVMHAMRNQPPEVAYGVQGAVGAVNLGLQVIREMRERRHPDEAARGFHSLSPEQWDAKTPAEQAALRQHTQKVSRAITVAQASFNMVGYDAKKDNTNGLTGNAFNSARATYAGVITTADVVSSAAMGVLVPGRGDAMAALLGTSNAMSSGDAWRKTAAAAGKCRPPCRVCWAAPDWAPWCFSPKHPSPATGRGRRRCA